MYIKCIPIECEDQKRRLWSRDKKERQTKEEVESEEEWMLTILFLIQKIYWTALIAIIVSPSRMPACLQCLVVYLLKEETLYSPILDDPMRRRRRRRCREAVQLNWALNGKRRQFLIWINPHSDSASSSIATLRISFKWPQMAFLSLEIYSNCLGWSICITCTSSSAALIFTL